MFRHVKDIASLIFAKLPRSASISIVSDISGDGGHRKSLTRELTDLVAQETSVASQGWCAGWDDRENQLEDGRTRSELIKNKIEEQKRITN